MKSKNKVTEYSCAGLSATVTINASGHSFILCPPRHGWRLHDLHAGLHATRRRRVQHLRHSTPAATATTRDASATKPRAGRTSASEQHQQKENSYGVADTSEQTPYRPLTIAEAFRLATFGGSSGKCDIGYNQREFR